MEFIDATQLTLTEWLHLLENRGEQVGFIDCCFPSDDHVQEYLATIDERSNEEIYRLIKRFLVPSGSFGLDEFRLVDIQRFLKDQPDPLTWLANHPYYSRLILWSQDKRRTPPWEGNTWVLELLPDHPKRAIDVIDNYLIAHFYILPDWRINGLFDAMTVIRAKFIGVPGNNPDKIMFLLDLHDRQFEHLVERLYHRMGYKTTLTPATRDGGVDVIAAKDIPGQKEILGVECKLYNHPVGVDLVRNIRGVVEYGGYNKGILFTTNRFTPDAEKLSKKDHIIELVSGEQLIVLLNEYFGVEWPLRIDRIIFESEREHKK